MKQQKIITTVASSYIDWQRGRLHVFDKTPLKYLDQADMLSQSLFQKNFKQLFTYEQNYVVLMMRKAGVQ